MFCLCRFVYSVDLNGYVLAEKLFAARTLHCHRCSSCHFGVLLFMYCAVALSDVHR